MPEESLSARARVVARDTKASIDQAHTVPEWLAVAACGSVQMLADLVVVMAERIEALEGGEGAGAAAD